MEIIKSSSPFYRNISLNYNASIKLYRIPKGLHNRNELQFWFQILLFMQKGKKSDLCLVMHHLCTLLASTTEDTQLSLHIHLIIFFLCFFPQSVHHSWRSSVFTQASWLFPYTLESELLWGRCRFKWLCLRVTSMSNSSSPPPLMGHPRLIYSSKYRFDFLWFSNILS